MSKLAAFGGSDRGHPAFQSRPRRDSPSWAPQKLAEGRSRIISLHYSLAEKLSVFGINYRAVADNTLGARRGFCAFALPGGNPPSKMIEGYMDGRNGELVIVSAPEGRTAD
jgi:hypothetical protein